MVEWTPARVEERLHKAAAVRTKLAGQAEGAAVSVERHRARKSMGPAANIDLSGDDIVSRAAEALSWLHWLEPADAELVAARLEGAAWKSICWRFGISRPTADRRFRYALALVAWRLNGHGGDRVPSMRSLLPEFGTAKCETSSGGTATGPKGDLRTGN